VALIRAGRPAHDLRIVADRRRPSDQIALHEIAAGAGEDIDQELQAVLGVL